MASDNEKHPENPRTSEKEAGSLALTGAGQTPAASAEAGIKPGELLYQADPRRWIALIVILSGSFMAGMDGFIVNVAIPSIQKGLGASFAAMQFVVAGYALTYAVLLITGGRLGDLYGRKRLFFVGMASFILASTLCGLALNPTTLVIARLFQGIAAALLFPQILALIRVTFTGEERDRAFGWYGVTIGLSQACGLVLGGLLLAANLLGLGWRILFLINVPIGLTALALAGPFVVEAKMPAAQKLDLGGVGTITLGLTLLIFPLIQGPAMGWPWWMFLSLGIAVILLIGFFFYERAIASRGGTPLLNQSLFHNPPFVRGLILVIIAFAASGAFLLILTFYLQGGLRLPAIVAGFVTLPYAIGVFTASFASVPIRNKIGKHVLTSGSLMMIVGTLIFIAIVALSSPKPAPGGLLPPLFLIGFGFGLILSPLVNILLSGIAPAHAGAASGMIGTNIQIGLSLGVALIGIIFFPLLANQVSYGTSFIWSLVAIIIALLLTIGLVFALSDAREAARA